MRTRLLCLLALALAPALAACGSDDPAATAPKGSPDNPIVATATDTGKEGQEPGYEQLLDGQSGAPNHRFSPCNLVTEKQARAILGGPIEQPLEAPQGPTCILRTRDGESFVTVAVQPLAFADLKPRMRQRQKIEIGGRAAYCGNHGQPVLYVPLGEDEVMAISGQCAVARRLAAAALPRLRS